MNIELANKLKELRQNAGLSQEELAAKLIISRQAVSKWERGEASPDIDNLVALSRLYNITVDELLTGESADNSDDDKPHDETSQSDKEKLSGNPTKDYVRINPFDGVHVHTVDGDHVDISWKEGVRVHSKEGDDVDITSSGMHVNSDNSEDFNGHIFSRGKDKKHFAYKFPYIILTVVAYLVLGLALNAWHPAWLVFLTIPLYYSLVDAIVKKNANHFAYPVLIVIIYLIFGLFYAAWHPMWILFLTIPLYYCVVSWIRSLCGHNERSGQDNTNI